MNKPLFSLHLNGFVFTPKLLPTLVFLFLLPILIGLGCWQLNRYAYKANIERSLILRAQMPMVISSQLDKPLSQLELRKITLMGQYDNQHQIFLDNRYHAGRIGYEVITPFHIKGMHEIILINRGWIPRGGNYPNLPKIAPVFGLQKIIGILKQPIKNPFIRERFVERWPWLARGIDLQQLANTLGRTIYPFMIFLSPGIAHGYTRDWQFVITPPVKHLGYAVQWLALALTLVIIYIVVNTRRG